MLALIAFSLQAAFASTIHTSYANDPNVYVPRSTAVHWYDKFKPHTHYLVYKGPDTRGANFVPPMELNGPLVGGFPAGFHPADIRLAYNVSLKGANAICVVDNGDLPTALGDFNTFSAQFGLPQETSTVATASTNRVFQVVYEVPGTVPASNVSSDWAGEEALDIEWAHAMAPNAKIYVVESSTGDLPGCNKIAAALLGVKEVSNSWGTDGEFQGETDYDIDFQTPGVVFLASAGDQGGVQGYPAESQYVVGVGGTSLVLNDTGTAVKSETAWIDSGGGPSSYVLRPSFQNKIASIVGSARGCPDLAAVADPYTGVAVYSASIGGWQVYGGTSVACPVVAGILNATGNYATSTLAEENLIYSLLGTTHFRDITQGTAGSFSAGPGWDFITGCGAPLDLSRPTVTYSLSPDQVTTLTGTYVSGNAGSLTAVDNNDYTVTGVPFAGVGSTADARVHLTVPNANPALAAKATVTITASANTVGVINEIFLYNYTTATYDLIGTPNLASFEQTFTVNLTGAQAANYVDKSGDVAVLSRALLPQRNYSRNNTAYTYKIDQINVSYTFFLD